jgi:hypothetical protein
MVFGGFRCGKGKKTRVHRKQVAKIKHRGVGKAVIVTGERERERQERGTRQTKPRKIIVGKIVTS